MYFQFYDRHGRHHKINILGCPLAAERHLLKQGCTNITRTNFVYTGR